jgi:hypothetical protein
MLIFFRMNIIFLSFITSSLLFSAQARTLQDLCAKKIADSTIVLPGNLDVPSLKADNLKKLYATKLNTFSTRCAPLLDYSPILPEGTIVTATYLGLDNTIWIGTSTGKLYRYSQEEAEENYHSFFSHDFKEKIIFLSQHQDKIYIFLESNKIKIIELDSKSSEHLTTSVSFTTIEDSYKTLKIAQESTCEGPYLYFSILNENNDLYVLTLDTRTNVTSLKNLSSKSKTFCLVKMLTGEKEKVYLCSYYDKKLIIWDITTSETPTVIEIRDNINEIARNPLKPGSIFLHNGTQVWSFDISTCSLSTFYKSGPHCDKIEKFNMLENPELFCIIYKRGRLAIYDAKKTTLGQYQFHTNFSLEDLSTPYKVLTKSCANHPTQIILYNNSGSFYYLTSESNIATILSSEYLSSKVDLNVFLATLRLCLYVVRYSSLIESQSYLENYINIYSEYIEKLALTRGSNDILNFAINFLNERSPKRKLGI